MARLWVAGGGIFALRRPENDAARRVATKTIHFALVVVAGGGIFAKTAKTR